MLLALFKLSIINYYFVIITKTWLKDSDESLFIQIPGYDHVSLNRKGPTFRDGFRIYYARAIKFISLDNKHTVIHDFMKAYHVNLISIINTISLLLEYIGLLNAILLPSYVILKTITYSKILPI